MFCGFHYFTTIQTALEIPYTISGNFIKLHYRNDVIASCAGITVYEGTPLCVGSEEFGIQRSQEYKNRRVDSSKSLF